MRSAYVLALLSMGACSLEPVDLTHKGCPCVEGWVCEETTSRCVLASSATDSSLDASGAASMDGGRVTLDDGGTTGLADGGGTAGDAGTADAGGGPLDGAIASDAGAIEQTLVIEDVVDTYVAREEGGSAFGSRQTLLVDADPIRYETLLRPVGLDAIPADADVLSATLELTCTDTGDPAEVYQVIEPWDESVTWNTRPAVEDTPDATYSPDAVGPVHIDVTGIAQRWMGGAPNHGVVLRSEGTEGSDYESSESTAVDDRPRLVVVYRE